MDDTLGETKTRRNALGTLIGAAAGGAALLTLPATPAKAATPDWLKKWLDKLLRNPRRLLPDFLRTVASGLEADSYEPIQKYQRANPDFKGDPGSGDKKSFPWGLIGDILIAIGEWMKRHGA